MADTPTPQLPCSRRLPSVSSPSSYSPWTPPLVPGPGPKTSSHLRLQPSQGSHPPSCSVPCVLETSLGQQLAHWHCGGRADPSTQYISGSHLTGALRSCHMCPVPQVASANRGRREGGPPLPRAPAFVSASNLLQAVSPATLSPTHGHLCLI